MSRITSSFGIVGNVIFYGSLQNITSVVRERRSRAIDREKAHTPQLTARDTNYLELRKETYGVFTMHVNFK